MSKHIIDQHVGRKLRHFRALANVTQKQLGDQVGVSFQQIQKYEIGTNRVSASKLYEIAKFLKVPVSAFFPEESNTSHFDAINANEAALIRAYRAASPEVRSAMHSFAQSLEAA
jgi:transcriptional regulator with XRE-family HTH domain